MREGGGGEGKRVRERGEKRGRGCGRVGEERGKRVRERAEEGEICRERVYELQYEH